MQVGAALLADFQVMFRAYLEKRQEKLARYETLKESYRTSGKGYIANIKRLRKEFKNDPQATAELGLQGLRDRTRAGYTEQAVTFYNKAMNTPDILAKLQPLGYSTEKLVGELRNVESYQGSISQYKKAQGECQKYVEDRDKAFKRLHDWTSAFVASCRYAFEESPQALEELGIFMRNQPKPRKKEDSETDPDTGPVTPPTPVKEQETGTQ
jgi:hypothetical protein